MINAKITDDIRIEGPDSAITESAFRWLAYREAAKKADDLAMFVRRLCSGHGDVSKVKEQAKDYLRRNGIDTRGVLR